MLRFFKVLFSSSKFMNRLADEIGVDRRMYKAALTQAGTNFANYEAWYSSPVGQRSETIGTMATSSCDPAKVGAAMLKAKFPNEESVDEFIRLVEQYQAHRSTYPDDAKLSGAGKRL